MDYINVAFNIFLSPITFLLFLFVTTPINHLVFTSGSEVNVMRLKPLAYLFFCLILLLIGLSLVVIYNITAPQKIAIVDLLQPKYYGLSVASWVLTLYTLKTYIKGMEGNIMGFLFSP